MVEVLADVVVAVFGLPRTHDDDAERAVLAALAARDRIATPGTGGRRVRAGVATGQALVRLRELAGAAGWEISGAVLTAAMAVKDAAPPGAILATAATLQATQRAVSYAPARLLRVAGAIEAASTTCAGCNGPGGRALLDRPLGPSTPSR